MPQPAARRVNEGPARRPPRLRKRRVMRIAGALSLTVVTVSGLGNVAMGGLGSGIARVDAFAGLDDRPPEGIGQNFLLVGIDGRDRIPAARRRLDHLGGEPCHCADTIMLAHLSADLSRLSVISVPRDSYVRLTGADGRTGRPAKINAAYSTGGPPLTVRTVERMTGLRIDHYVELDFASFMKAVDALGGVPVCTARPLRDPESGLDLPAGTTLLDGSRALAYVRARHLDGTADLGRMRRQQRFVADLIRRVAGPDVLLDPVRLGRTVGAALDSVRADKDLEPADLMRLTGALASFSPSSTEFASVPVYDLNHQVPGIGTTVTWDETRAARLFAAVRADEPLTPPGPSRPAPTAARSRALGGARSCP